MVYSQENKSTSLSTQSLTKANRRYPHFDTSVFQEITGLVGKPAFLTCIVKNLGNETVKLYYLIIIETVVKYHDSSYCEIIVKVA